MKYSYLVDLKTGERFKIYAVMCRTLDDRQQCWVIKRGGEFEQILVGSPEFKVVEEEVSEPG